MSVNYLKTLERRADELEKHLRADARYTELEAVKIAIEAYKRGAKAGHEIEVRLPRANGKDRVADAIVRADDGSEHVIEVKRVVSPPLPQPSRGKVLVEAAIAILRTERRYLNSGQLADRLIREGYDLAAKSTPQAYLSAHLSGSKLVENVKGHGYGLVEWHAPSAEASIGPQAERTH